MKTTAIVGDAPAQSSVGARDEHVGEGATPQQGWTSERVRESLARGIEAWNAHDADRVLALVTDDIIWEDPSIPDGGSLRGKRAARRWMEFLWRAMPDMTYELVGEPFVSLDGTKVATGWRMFGHFTGPLDPPGWAPTSGRIELKGVDILEFEGDLVRRESSYSDMAAIARQVGALPAPRSIAERVGVFWQRLQARRRRARRR